jgi:hypothetical protein
MNKMLGPAGAMLVGASFICLCVFLGLSAAEMPSYLPDLQSELKESNSMSMGQHLSGLQFHESDLMPQTLPSEEKMTLGGSHSVENVSDLKAVNGVKKRDVVYEGAQEGDPEANGLANSLDVSVTGLDQVKSDWLGKGWEEENIEKKVDDALKSAIKYEENNDLTVERYPKSQRLGNNMNIVVSGITVSAINTVKGGNAVANSNIIIKPTQIIVCPSEVDEKLK